MRSPTLDGFRQDFAGFSPPVIVFNKSHSGSRLLGRTLSRAGVFMGSHLNESWDSLDVFELVEYLVVEYYPDYSRLWDPRRPPDRKLSQLLRDVFERHLENRGAAVYWGWKLCETTYILPVLDYCFPNARFIHLIRDGRDVAFSDHKAPDSPFWRKIYFNTAKIRSYEGLRLTGAAYRRQSHLFNATHWVNSVSVGRAFGAMLRDRYLELRYEDLCSNFDRTAGGLLKYLELACPEPPEGMVYQSSIGKYKSQPKSKQDQVLRIEKPLLLALGYLEEDGDRASRWPWRSDLIDHLIDRWKRRSTNRPSR